MSQVVYSIGVRFAGGGIGTTAWHAVQGIHSHHMLHRLLCSSAVPTEVPANRIRQMGLPHRILRRLAIYDRRRLLEYLQGEWFDRWAASHLEEAAIFHGWANFARHAIPKAHEMGMITVVDWPITHPVHQYRLLKEEFARLGLSYIPIPKWRERNLAEIEEADRIVVPSAFVLKTFLSHGVPREKIAVIPFGVDAERFSPPVERPESPIRFLFVGQIGIRKGVHYLLEAWRRLALPDAELILAGRVQNNSQAMLARYDGLPGVRWAGHVDPVGLYRSAHVFVFPSLDEGSALVTYEAMASGLPLIVTENSGSLARGGVDGIFVPVRDVDALAAAMAQLYREKDLREEMGRAARRRIEPYTWERYGDEIAALYQRLTGERE